MVMLEARDVAYEYPGPVKAVLGVDLELKGSELVTVIGPNGSGKSTLARCLGGLLMPQRGSITIDGVRLDSLDDRARARRLAMVPQYLPLLPDVRVLHFVLGGRYPWIERFAGATQHDLDVVRSALARCDAADLESRLMSELSGGQRQRVLLARALAQEAQFLLIDEPTSALDPEHQISVFELIAEQTCHGAAILVITHDLNLASQFATRVVLMDEGRVVRSGSVADVLNPAVLEPVYGKNLRFGEVEDPSGKRRPYVIPWRRLGQSPS